MSNKHMLAETIRRGQATPEQIEQYLGPDLQNRLHAQWNSMIDQDFDRWHAAVIEPLDLGIDRQAWARVFTGVTSIDELAAGMSTEQAERFVEGYPRLHQAYVDHLARRGVL